MYKLWNYLFGYDYIYYTSYGSNFKARIRHLPDKRLYIKEYDAIKIIEKESDIIWLTCKKDKYFKEVL